jgi:CheY-like chemotaxis protein/HPt (histidine-containing phosphotransfer) domain-containing protein
VVHQLIGIRATKPTRLEQSVTEEQQITESRSSTAQFGRPLRILVVDDDPQGRSLMDVMLSPHGYKLDFASDGREALEAVQNQPYDLVFMDLMLPDMNGREVCGKIREWEAGKRHMPIVAVTAYDLPGQPLQLVKAGMDDYIFKPYDLRGLTRIIQLYAGDDGKGTYARDGSGQPVQVPDAPVLDLKGNLLDFADDVGAFKEVLRDFIESLPRRLENMRQAYADDDYTRLGREAHSLKGISAGLGAVPLSRLASQLGRSCADGQRASAGEEIDQIEHGMADLRAAAESFLTSSPGQPGSASV